MKIFDIHHHVGVLRIGAESGIEEAEADADMDRMIENDYILRSEKMKRHGITHACLLPGNSYSMMNGIQDTKRMNDFIAKYRDTHTDLFPVAMGLVELSHGEASLEEVDRIHEELKLNGLVFHHRFQGGAINTALMWPILERIQKHNLKVFIHVISESNMEAPWRLEILADEFPEITFVALDAFSGISQGEWMSYIAKKHSNILFDTGCMVSVGNDLKSFIKSHGTKRVLFGSTCYVTPDNFAYPYPLIELKEMGLSQEELEDVFYLNAAKYFDLL
ncbi:amidohydrolase family protein [Brevibacillus sp. NRS-1366]|uniref:amidohydrolase family protein n=1 Tax=Brevibacillus sp. NRS-1366 TaxID=3233899 RepID=UPI003D190388